MAFSVFSSIIFFARMNIEKKIFGSFNKISMKKFKNKNLLLDQFKNLPLVVADGIWGKCIWT